MLEPINSAAWCASLGCLVPPAEVLLYRFCLAFFLVLGSCADPAATADLDSRLTALETKVAELEKGGGAKASKSDPKEEAAGELLRAAGDAAEALEYDEAKSKLAELTEKYPRTRAARSARKLQQELEIIGADAGELEVEQWLSSNQTAMNDGNATLLVFWELWCPHCRKEVPKLQETYSAWNAKGLNMVAVTRMSKETTRDAVDKFLEENNVSYPVAKEAGSISERFAIRGIPAAAVVKDGKIVWRGHPARIDEKMIEGWIGS